MSELRSREAALLKSIIETYIDDGQPVGSKALVESSGLEVSSATIRNIMKDLEALGYLKSPHTSAGRVPTESGYRLFIDNMLTIKPMQENVMHEYQTAFDLSSSKNTNEILHSATQAISTITQLAGVVALPKKQTSLIHQIEFIKLSDNRSLVVLVMKNGDIQNKVIQLDRDYSRDEFIKAGNYLSDHYSGLDIRTAANNIRAEIIEMKDRMDGLMAGIIHLGEQTFKEDQDSMNESLVTAGETHLMSYDELADIKKLKQLFDAFSEKSDILHLLEQCSDAEGVKIFIGHESGYSVMDQCSVITSTYESADGQLGVIGVIGPTRIAYEEVIPIVDATAQILSKALAYAD